MKFEPCIPDMMSYQRLVSIAQRNRAQKVIASPVLQLMSLIRRPKSNVQPNEIRNTANKQATKIENQFVEYLNRAMLKKKTRKRKSDKDMTVPVRSLGRKLKR